MMRCLVLACLWTVLMATAVPAAEMAATVQFTPEPPVLPGVASFPRVTIINRAYQTARINRDLRGTDARVRTAAAACRPPGQPRFEWRRTVTATMRGPRFLSLVAEDHWSCGTYPDASRLALVFDLDTGAPVNWLRLLPRTLAQETATDDYADGTVLGLVKSKTLNRLYNHGLTKNCRGALTDDELAFQLWPDARADGLVLLTMEVPHAAAVCARSVVIPTRTLRPLGVSPALLDAIDAAHQAGRKKH